MRKLSPNELRIKIAQTPKDLEQAKIADDLAFGEHHGITIEELELLFQHGIITLITIKATGQIIAQTQTLLEPIPTLPYSFDPDVAYGYGRGVLPEFQRQGLSKILAQQEELNARHAGKKELRITVRVENHSNLRARLKEGFLIFDYAPNFYGPNPEDARLILKKHLDAPREALKTFADITTVPVVFGDEHDPIAHQQIASLITNGFQGVRITKEGIIFAHIL